MTAAGWFLFGHMQGAAHPALLHSASTGQDGAWAFILNRYQEEAQRGTYDKLAVFHIDSDFHVQRLADEDLH